ncbi:aminoglycoside phosphotransferase family protein [Asanoa sp. WMMD1127]|uniref:phosphotransferase family protein n=1 Tax=Asanoa sp. WMMD1127 TaxID=3016107 RepID=UPI002416774D|nr:aminoglycoside phosphotransferase family protein [Asanoa sp. WMMD1127]MDG4827055.1 aminoglycoside phosphotransferase family protein [Asanoa sp. WMMD1127]
MPPTTADLEPRTQAWVDDALPPGHAVTRVSTLRGGWTSRICRLDVEGPDGPYALVLRSFQTPFFVRHAPNLLAREADILRLLADTDVPAARLVAVDPAGDHCDHPSLLMTLLKGRVDLTEDHSPELARRLVRIHAITPTTRPRTYQPWTDPDRVRPPGGDDALWRRAISEIRRDPPPYEGAFLHRDFHPGNVLFTGGTITGVVDWVETSWGPTDLDVAHCATATALLHGAEAGMRFADHYRDTGGTLDADPAAHRYWRLLDALAFAPAAEKVVGPWRELGRTDIDAAARLTSYVEALLS